MKLVVWSPAAFLADGISSILGREPDMVVAATHQIDAGTLTAVDGLVVHGVPLESVRRLVADLSPAVRSSTVAVLLIRAPDPLLVSRAQLFGFAGVVDLALDTTSVIASIRELVELGPSIEASDIWTLDSNAVLQSHFCQHCRDTRDVDILRHIVDGHTDAQIAYKLNLNAQTVRNRVSNMLLESGMPNRTQLAIDFYRSMLTLNGAESGGVRQDSTIRES
ncbi:MAG: LuxR C-terminal-related transcriptional regulator [Actinomycetota bacterium]|nr:LuxR C-terminal-related transcriptional regulator [Actinomycetota bacterium]MDA2971853.1 LuxR C-terminal-related transcriptional regulator [Actinomycetota bacterium]MDA3001229.1 LuxR C-terminal-related transcriptional regulator [Actinomycetota bacterium]